MPDRNGKIFYTSITSLSHICKSIWSKTAGFPERPALAGSLDVDAAVIGGGMAGVLTAHFLKAAGLRTVILEASRVGYQLEWNPDEKSWDCPCHGSRFDYRGNLIDNPAQEGLERD